MRRYAAVLLDIDGTLVDSNDAHADAWVETFAQHGLEVAFARVRRMIGMGGDRVVEDIAGLARDSRKSRKLQDECAERFMARWLARVKPLEGTRELVLRLQREGYEVVLASAAHADALEALLAIAGVEDLLGERARPPKPAASKPDPDTIEVALTRVDADRSRAVMIGDTPYDVAAARAARVDVIGFTTGGYSVEALAGAVAVYDGPTGLLARWDDSPLGAHAWPGRG
jgi:phosphoglycolate phosphatase-like HAD superfamily hydrolase